MSGCFQAKFMVRSIRFRRCYFNALSGASNPIPTQSCAALTALQSYLLSAISEAGILQTSVSSAVIGQLLIVAILTILAA